MLVARSPSDQAAAWPVVETVQDRRHLHAGPRPGPRPRPAPRRGRHRGRSADQLRTSASQGFSRSRCSRCANPRPAARLRRERAGDAPPQQRPLEHGRCGHGSVRAAPAGGARPAARAPAPREPFTVMANVLGGDYPELYPAYRHLMARDPGLKIHLYGKGVRPAQDRARQRERHRPRRPARAGQPRGRLPLGSDHRMTDPQTRHSRQPVVGLVMGSDSDWPVSELAAEALEEFGIPFEADVVSAHRMPDEMIAYGQRGRRPGLRVLIAGAGGAAHLPGMLAAVTPLPVIGVPVPLNTSTAWTPCSRSCRCRQACRWRQCRSAGPATPGSWPPASWRQGRARRRPGCGRR